MRPIIFIPGIEATALVNANTFDFNRVWNAFDTVGTAAATKAAGPYIEEKLQLNPLYDEDIKSLIERNHLARLPYERTISNITSKLEENNDSSPMYLFGYDWRLSNEENGMRLHRFTVYLKNKLAASTKDVFEGFRFLTHSMGALVFSCYLNNLKKDFSDIDKAALCAPPFQGSPFALVHMVKGDGGFKSFLNSIFGRNEDIRKVVRTYPALYELLPWYDTSLVYEDNQAPVDLTDISQWQSNIWDDIEELFTARLASLTEFRKSKMFPLNKLPDEVRAKMVIVAGSEDDTVVQLQIRREQKKIKNFILLDKDKIRNGSGDGTVPLVSSTIYKNDIKTLVVPKRGIFNEVADNLDFHGMFLRDSRVQNIIIRFLTQKLVAAKVGEEGLQALRGKQADWWKSLGNDVENASPF